MSLCAAAGFGASCNVVLHGEPSEAEKAFLAADFPKAESLFRDGLKHSPKDKALASGLVHALLRQNKLQEAHDVASAALAEAPQDAGLVALRGEVEYRQGVPWEAAKSADEARKLDPCNARALLLSGRLARLSSLYATSQRFIRDAHTIDPQDPDIRSEWIRTLPLKQQVEELKIYSAQPNGQNETELKRMRLSLSAIEKYLGEPRKPCRLVSGQTATEMPFERPRFNPERALRFNVEAQINRRYFNLLIDTGATGLVIGPDAAQKAGLKPLSDLEINGIGDEGARKGYLAIADSIQIGGLEFQDCAIQVLDWNYLSSDSGIIGMDVFSHFLVTLDFPARKLLLGALPPRPGDPIEAKTESAARESSLNLWDDSSEPHDRYVAPEMKDYARVFRVEHNLILPASLSEQRTRLFILDTGSWTTTISPDAAREVTKLRGINLPVRGVGGSVKEVYSADSVTFHFANISQKTTGVVAFDMSKESEEAGMELSGLLGAITLKQMTIHIDYRDGLVKFDYDPHHGLY